MNNYTYTQIAEFYFKAVPLVIKETEWPFGKPVAVSELFSTELTTAIFIFAFTQSWK